MKQNFFDHLDGGWGDLIADTYKEYNKQSLLFNLTFKGFFAYDIYSVDESQEYKFDLIFQDEDMKYHLEEEGYKKRYNRKIYIGELYSPNYTTVGFSLENAVLSFTRFEVSNINKIVIIDDSRPCFYFDDYYEGDLYQELIDSRKIVLADPETMKFPPLQELND